MTEKDIAREVVDIQESRMPGNPLVRFDEGRVGRTARCRSLSYSTVSTLGVIGAGPRARKAANKIKLKREWHCW